MLSVFPNIPGYRIERSLGEGGMAHVYLATQLSLDRQVAIKVVRFSGPDREALATRFENEARTIAQLEHPNIVSVFDVGRTQEGQPYYTMAYLPNGDLAHADIVGQGERIGMVLEAVARALGFAHAQGVIHRDVKPENVLFDREHRPRLADFGISRSLHRGVRITDEGYAPGSAAYMSPEQARGVDVDARSDLYSLGVVAYELLVGQTPYQRTDPLAMALAHHEQPIPKLPRHQSAWQPLIDKLLAKRPEDRFQSADAFLTALAPLQHSLAPTRIAPVRVQIGKPPARPTLIWALLVCVMLAVAGLLWQQRGAAPSVESSVAAVRASSIELARFDPDLAQLPARIEARHWFEPAAGSASALIASALTKARSEAHLGVANDFITAVGAVVVEAIDAGRDAPALALLERLRTFKAAQALQQSSAAIAMDRALLAALDRRLDAAERRTAPQSIAGLSLLLNSDPALAIRWQRLSAKLVAGNPMQDRNGPKLSIIAVGTGHVAMAVNEVTRAEYQRFIRAEPREHERCPELGSALGLMRRRTWNETGFAQTGEHPVVCVTGADALAYTRWLSQQTGQRYRLPSIAEWRAAAAQIDQRQSSCLIGNVLDRSDDRKLALRDRHDCNDGAARTQLVGSYRGSAWGIYDLVGNVSEWVQACDPARSDCTNLVALGSSWRSGSAQPLLDRRSDIDAADAELDIGFRVVREL